ncbi:RidA family protein [Pseudonocardia sp. C8]|uniref:Rid family hydrolase n=1 Tax=Pseudonocardia sp. C8 TaxID=2762759 RepID=UPI0016430032|nr:Rid family hydrolase [Pseudonocardia sp. C8]MBC3191782.1 RidA family protein [Pseudonocardia sp. C8]
MTSSVNFVHERHRASAGIPAEEEYRFSRAVRVGDRVIVSGCPAIGPDGQLDPALKGDMYGQCRVAIEMIEKVLGDLDSSLDHVVKVNFYITDAQYGADAVRAMRDFFGRARPAATLVGTPFLFGSDFLVEIEVEAVD